MTVAERLRAPASKAVFSAFGAGGADWLEPLPARAKTRDSAAGHHSGYWFSGVAALGLSVVLVVLIGLFAILTVDRLRVGFGWATHTNMVLQEIARVKEGLLEQRAAARGFVITGNAVYVGLYNRSRADEARELKTLLSLVADDPPQIQRARAFRTLLTVRQEKFDRAGGISPARRLAIAAEMRSPRQGPGFLQFAAAPGSLLDGLQAAEVLLLSQRQQDTQDGVARLQLLSVLAGVLALMSGMTGMYLIKRERGALRIQALQAELMHAQRLDMANQSSSMLAHELSQPLTAAANYLTALKRLSESTEGKTPGNIADLAMRARTQIARASSIVARLHRFIDKHATVRSPEALATLIEDAVSLLGTLDPSIALEISIEPGLPDVAIDRVQVQQVLVNLMRNAIEAMRGVARSKLRLTVSSSPPGALLFSLADNGPGLSREVAERLFQPFVTSKKDGLGVGLSICRTIIVDHGGKIWVESSARTGTVFHFTLPVVPRALAA